VSKRALLALAATALAALMTAALGSAAAPAHGQLVVTSPVMRSGAASAPTITTIQAPNTYRTTVYVPAGYRAAGGLGAVGAMVGKATIFVNDSDGSRTTLNGLLTVTAPSNYASDSCSTASTKHAAVWLLSATQTQGAAAAELPIYVDNHRSDPSLPAAFAYRLQWCAGATGLNIGEVDLHLVRMFDNPDARGMYLWRAVYDPVASSGKAIESATGTGVAAAVPIDAQTTMKWERARQGYITFSGKVSVVNQPLAGVKVQIYAGHSAKLAASRARATVRTNANGTYRVTVHLTGNALWYARARASTPYRDITAGGGCSAAAEPVLAAQNCVDATLAPFNLLTRVQKVL